MAKREQSSKPGANGSGQKSVNTGAFVDRDIAGMSPEECQEMCKPTEPEPVRMHYKMAGGE